MVSSCYQTDGGRGNKGAKEVIYFFNLPSLRITLIIQEEKTQVNPFFFYIRDQQTYFFFLSIFQHCQLFPLWNIVFFLIWLFSPLVQSKGRLKLSRNSAIFSHTALASEKKIGWFDSICMPLVPFWGLNFHCLFNTTNSLSICSVKVTQYKKSA